MERKITYSYGQRALRWPDENQSEYDAWIWISLGIHHGPLLIAMPQQRSDSGSVFAVDCAVLLLIVCFLLCSARICIDVALLYKKPTSLGLFVNEYNFTCSTNLPQVNKTFTSGFCIERKYFPFYLRSSYVLCKDVAVVILNCLRLWRWWKLSHPMKAVFHHELRGELAVCWGYKQSIKLCTHLWHPVCTASAA